MALIPEARANGYSANFSIRFFTSTEFLKNWNLSAFESFRKIRGSSGFFMLVRAYGR